MQRLLEVKRLHDVVSSSKSNMILYYLSGRIQLILRTLKFSVWVSLSINCHSDTPFHGFFMFHQATTVLMSLLLRCYG